MTLLSTLLEAREASTCASSNARLCQSDDAARAALMETITAMAVEQGR